MQWPPEHTSDPVHAVPQSPQWFGSSCSSTHDVPHLAMFPMQPQLPPLQKPPAPHCVPQVPQLFGSVWVLAQTALAPLPHDVVGAMHVVWQVPALQTWVPVQALEHMPQCCGSVDSVTHAPEQSDSAGNDGVQTQCPPAHTSGAEHAVPHTPQ